MLSAAVLALATAGHPRWAITLAVVASITAVLGQILPNPTTA